MLPTAIQCDEGGREQDEEDSRDSSDEGQPREEEEFLSTQRDTEADKPPRPSRQKRRRLSTPPVKTAPHKKRRDLKADNEYGVARGIDFLDVACVLNFDLPTSPRAYTHRVGRTARAGRGGTALSFVLPSSEFGKHKAAGGVPSTRQDEAWERIAWAQHGPGFRYRMEDALLVVTRYAIREARLKGIKQGLLASDKLKARHAATAHFEDNPNDLEYLKHKPLHPTRVQPHMKHVPKVPDAECCATARGHKFGSGGGRGGKEHPLKKFSLAYSALPRGFSPCWI
ncbi:hypothetical protein BC827DRAFT_1264360 [Russula dissimulans]|nr:hypothetical protein BC827DRAFT_1264360 [Russula dissimulans]